MAPHRDDEGDEDLIGAASEDDPDHTTDSDANDESGSDGAVADDPEEYGPTEGPAGREVVVPPRLYKTVTVMSTLLAMVSVVGGFVALDAATNRARASAGEVDPLLALLGLGLIVGGAAAYAYATRFRAAGMGSGGDGDESDEREPPEREAESESESEPAGAGPGAVDGDAAGEGTRTT